MGGRPHRPRRRGQQLLAGERNYPLPPHEQAVNQSVMRAREFLASEAGALALPDTYYKGDAETRSAEVQSLLSDAVRPDWTGAAVWQTDGGVIAEIPATLTKSVDYTTLVEQSGRQVSFVTQEPNVRVLVVEPRDGRETYCVIATFLPDEGWGGDADELTIGDKADDYSGLLVYSLPDGTPAWGWRYDSGEATHIVLFGDGAAELQDPDISVSMGVSGGALTRRTYYIEPVSCVAHVHKVMYLHERLAESDGGYSSEYSDKYTVWVDPGSGSGGVDRRKGSSASSAAPLAKRLFKGPSSLDWGAIEKMIKDIMADCMGGNLYNALVNGGRQINFQFTPSGPGATAGSFSLSEWRVTSDKDSGSLFHEMFHAYQAWQLSKTAYDNSSANRELEAYLAEYMFAGDIPRSYYRGNIMELSKVYLSGKGTLNNLDAVGLIKFNEMYENTIDLINQQYGGKLYYDDKRTPNQNFQNIANLTKNC